MKELIKDVFNELNSKCNYALLRNKEGVINASCRDVDLLITRSDYNDFISLFKNLIEQHSFKIITVDNRQYMSFWGVARISDSKIDIISFDFIFDIHVQDIVLFETESILERRELQDNIYCIRTDDEFLTKYLANKLLGAEYPEKYSHLQDEALSQYGDVIDGQIKKIFGKKCNRFTQLQSIDSRKLLKNLRIIKFRNNFLDYSIRRTIYLLKIVSRLIKPAGVSIAFTGADGVGKTTIIDTIIFNLKKISDITLYHHRPSVMGNIGDVAQKSGLKKDIDKDYQKPHRGGRKGRINSLLRLTYYSVDYIIGYWLKVRFKLLFGGFVIFDRYYNDIVVDSRRSSIWLNTKFLYGWGKLFIPKMKYNILLTADPDIILSRKQELDREGIERINTKMEYLAAKKGYYMVMNNGSAEEAVDKILSIVIDEQHKRNLRRV